MFFSLVTKNQVLNTKCQPKFLSLFQIEKRRCLTGSPLLFSNWNENKKTQLTKVVSMWFLVTSQSNEKNKCVWDNLGLCVESDIFADQVCPYLYLKSKTVFRANFTHFTALVYNVKKGGKDEIMDIKGLSSFEFHVGHSTLSTPLMTYQKWPLVVFNLLSKLQLPQFQFNMLMS